MYKIYFCIVKITVKLVVVKKKCSFQGNLLKYLVHLADSQEKVKCFLKYVYRFNF